MSDQHKYICEDCGNDITTTKKECQGCGSENLRKADLWVKWQSEAGIPLEKWYMNIDPDWNSYGKSSKEKDTLTQEEAPQQAKQLLR